MRSGGNRRTFRATDAESRLLHQHRVRDHIAVVQDILGQKNGGRDVVGVRQAKQTPARRDSRGVCWSILHSALILLGGGLALITAQLQRLHVLRKFQRDLRPRLHMLLHRVLVLVQEVLGEPS